jgi:hypothetical protein
LKASITSLTSTSGAEAPAVMPIVLASPITGQSMSPARCTSIERSQPCLRATSTRRCELELLGAPTTRIRSHFGAMVLTTSWRLVVA